jgi:hypothetical protein
MIIFGPVIVLLGLVVSAIELAEEGKGRGNGDGNAPKKPTPKPTPEPAKKVESASSE